MMSVALTRDPEEKDLSSKDSENEDSREDSSGSMKSVPLSQMESGAYHTFGLSRAPDDLEKDKNKSPKEYDFDSDGKVGKSRMPQQKQTSPLVIQWLQENYEGAEGTSLPRSTLYAHYKSYCDSMKLEIMNPASFGKLIRSIFPNLKTRRLGTRGHSKYHYYGIRIKATSELRLPNFSTGEQIMSLNGAKGKSRMKADYESDKIRMDDGNNMYEINGQPVTTGATNVALPDFSIPDMKSILPETLTQEHALAFFASYRQHCQTLVDVVYKHHFLDVEKLLQHYWQTLPPQFRLLSSVPEVIEQICEKDQITYKAMATVLLPNVLQALPVSIPQGIRQFAKQLETWVANSIDGMSPNFIARKMAVVKKFSQSLHKQASLNHLTQAARAVLQNTTQVSQMIIDWNRLDFEFIKDQASWICQCGEDLIQNAQDDFKRFLTDRVSLEQWASWLQDIVNKIIGKCMDPRELVQLSRQLLLNWSYYSTLIIRDLTIRNASSFGSFHLLRTLFDEYIFYLIETKFASLIDTSVPFAPRVQNLISHPNESFTTHQNMDSYGLESLLNKEATRAPSHLPFPFQQDAGKDSMHAQQLGQISGQPNITQGMPDEEYAHMLHGADLLHLQSFQQYPNTRPPQGPFGNGMPAYAVPPQQKMDEMRLNQMVNAQHHSSQVPPGLSSSGLDRLTPPPTNILRGAPKPPTNVIYNFNSPHQPQMNAYHPLNVNNNDPNQMRTQYSTYDSLLHAQPASQYHYGREPDPKRIRMENGIPNSQVK